MNGCSNTLLHEFFGRSVRKYPSKVALVCGKERWTYAALDTSSGRLAHFLAGLGVRRGDRVAVLLDNSSECVISLYGILKSAGVFVILNGSMKSKKLAHILRDSGARVLITHTTKVDVVSHAISRVRSVENVIWVGNADFSSSWGVSGVENHAFSAIMAQTFSAAKPAPSSNIDLDLASLIYTSGSTGEPKGVMCSHASMVSVARSIIKYLGNTEEDVILDVLPLSFDYGLYQVLMAFIFGGTVVLESTFVYLHPLLDRIGQERVTGLQKYNLSSLRYVTNTAAALPVDHIRQIRALLSHVQFFSMYGLTECKRVSYMPPEELDNRPSSVGKPIPNCEAFVVKEDGSRAGPGEIGELVVRGSNVMGGYWNSPELSASTFRPGKYPGEKVLYTGDLFRSDEEGFLYFVGRKDDMIKTRGERVSPKEVECALCELEGIIEAAVVGVPDEVLGQAVKAFVVTSSENSLSEKAVIKHCMQNLEHFMVPKYVACLPELPTTPNGKVDKRALLEL
jgi:long-chain acyl-CoA synthetase